MKNMIIIFSPYNAYRMIKKKKKIQKPARTAHHHQLVRIDFLLGYT